MAGFTGIQWAPGQLSYSLNTRQAELLDPGAKVHAVSRSVHYGLCLTFEGIRYFVKESEGRLHVVFANLDHNLRRFRSGIAYNLSTEQQALVPTRDALVDLFVAYLGSPALRPFMTEMARSSAQGYLRPFTVDDDQSIGVTFPANPVIRMVTARYTSYLGEPFKGVAIPWLVRAVGVNGTGCLKLGVNYLQSVKAVQAAKAVLPEAISALFLDDRPDRPLEERHVTEWDSSCCLIALDDGTVVKIPESPLILPSVTIRGITALLRRDGVQVQERDMTYGELVGHARKGDVVTVCSIGTAGVSNRCSSLVLVDEHGKALTRAESRPDHPVYGALGRARAAYWDVYREVVEPPEGMELNVYELGPAV